MHNITVEDIVKATKGKLLYGDPGDIVCDVIIDSRKVTLNSLFVPLIGERSDGHDYIDKAFENGASCVITQKNIKEHKNKSAVMVENTEKALGEIAKYYKNMFNIKTIGVTGSVGKTTTKDMLYSVMSKGFLTLKTEGNYNNEIGLPLTAMRLDESYEAAVFEMGMSDFGEIHYLCDIARPDVGIITNIGMSHIENLGSQEGIFKAKTEICDFFDEKSVLIVNGDDKFLKKTKDFEGFEVITYGISEDCDYKATDIEDLGIDGTEFTVNIYGKPERIYVKTAGVHNVYNALAAIACGVHYNISAEKIKEGIENFSLTKMRMAVVEKNGFTIINDCYNSSPDSVNAALKVLETQKTRKVAVLGDILEMGSYAKEAHTKLGKSVYDNGVDILVTAGKNSKFIAQGARDAGMSYENIISYDTTDDLVTGIENIVEKGDSILIKASRGMHFEKVFEKLTEEKGE